jgi:hypothetical protein
MEKHHLINLIINVELLRAMCVNGRPKKRHMPETKRACSKKRHVPEIKHACSKRGTCLKLSMHAQKETHA